MAKRKRLRLRKERAVLLALIPVTFIVLLGFGVSALFRHPEKPVENQTTAAVHAADQSQRTGSQNQEDQTSSNHTESKETESNQKSQKSEKSLEDQKDEKNNSSIVHTQEIETLKNTAAGSAVDISPLNSAEIESLFYEEVIPDDTLAMMQNVTYVADQDFITPDDLRLIRVLYKDYYGQDCIGELIVNKKIADDTKEVFEELYNIGYPIALMVLPDLYGGDDNLSMANNNTSAFSFRLSDGLGIVEHEHSLGLAIDINPLQNPQVIEEDGEVMVFPYGASPWSDRSDILDHMISNTDPAYQIFTEHGFIWGGDWSARQDYMHFEKDYDQSMYHVFG